MVSRAIRHRVRLDVGFVGAMTRALRIECAWCLAETRTPPREDDSHGICHWHAQQLLIGDPIRCAIAVLKDDAVVRERLERALTILEGQWRREEDK